jgi:DNA-binding transcriptional LysR family regulator
MKDFVGRSTLLNSPNWERLRIFKAVLESGSLSEAARRLRISQPTVSRQVKALEREFDEILVEITPDGILPTAAALRITPALDEMALAAEKLGFANTDLNSVPVVRVTCGPWLAGFISRNISELIGQPVDTEIELVSSVAFADVPRREADLAIRNRRPENSRLTMRKLPDYACAVYGAEELVKNHEDAFDNRRFSTFNWATFVGESEHFPTARWLSSKLKKNSVVRFSTSINMLDAVRGGQVLAVLPCFAAESENGIVRVSDTFVPDYGGHWLIMPDDLRRRPYVRRIAGRIVEFLNRNHALLQPQQ